MLLLFMFLLLSQNDKRFIFIQQTKTKRIKKDRFQEWGDIVYQKRNTVHTHKMKQIIKNCDLINYLILTLFLIISSLLFRSLSSNEQWAHYIPFSIILLPYDLNKILRDCLDLQI